MKKANKLNLLFFSAAIAFLPLTNIYAATANEILSDDQSSITINGVVARKGSIAATITNVAALNQLSKKNDVGTNNAALRRILADQRELMPTLCALGLLDLFSLSEWVTPTQGEGRVYIGVLAMQEFPHLAGDKELALLKAYYQTYSPALQAEIDTCIR